MKPTEGRYRILDAWEVLKNLTIRFTCSCPNHTIFPSTFGCEIVGDATMARCQVVHINILACSTFFVVMYNCSHGYPTSQRLKKLQITKVVPCGHTTSCLWWAPWVQHVSKRGRHNVGCDHIWHRQIGWMVMAHHENHCGRLIHLQKMHFQFGVIKALLLTRLMFTYELSLSLSL